MRRLLLLILIISAGARASSQVTISGKVKDNKGRPLPGATVSLKNTYDGALVDSSGNFKFTTTEKGEFLFVATNVGYRTYEENMVIANTPITRDISLKEELSELKAVTVISGSFAAGDTKRAATVLNSLDVATVGGGNADITAAVKTLPGAQQVGEQEGLFVRGGAGYETKQFIDGTLVNNPYYTSIPDLATRGRFSPFLFKGTVFSTGGYSALYGQALSSALILESIDLPERSAANLSLSPIILGGGFQKLSNDKKSSWGVNYNYVNLVAYFNLVSQAPDYFRMPVFHNADANFRFRTKRGGMVKYYTTFDRSNMGLRRPDIDSAMLKDAFGLSNLNWYNNLSWKENLGSGWKMNLGLSYSTNKDDITQELQDQHNIQQFYPGSPWADSKNFKIKSRQQLSQVKAVFEKRLFGISAIRFGSEYMHGFNYSNFNSLESKLTENFYAVFAETDIVVTNDLAAKIGGRYEYSTIIGKSNIAPRLSIAHKVGNGAQVSAAYGVFYQKPENTQLVFTRQLGYTKATHYILTYQKTTNERIFRAETFYKKYDDLVKTFPDGSSFLYNNDGRGFAQGIEFFWRDKKSIKNLDYWISYSYLDTKRDYLNYPGQLRPNFAATHTASLVTKRFFIKMKTGFNLTYSYATGRPYYNFVYNGPAGKYVIADQGKTKEFHNLGFSMNYVPSINNPNAKVFWVLVASVTNVLGYTPVYGYNYSYNGMNKQPITNPAKRFYFIGVFFSWGVDRTQDAINSNL